MRHFDRLDLDLVADVEARGEPAVTGENASIVEGVPGMTSVVAQKLKWRQDEVTDGGNADALMANAPGGEEHFFTVPKVVE